MLEQFDEPTVTSRILQFASELNNAAMLDSDILIAKRSLVAAMKSYEYDSHNRVEVHLCNAIASLLQAMRTRGAL
jgi:hypothetical protein